DAARAGRLGHPRARRHAGGGDGPRPDAAGDLRARYRRRAPLRRYRPAPAGLRGRAGRRVGRRAGAGARRGRDRGVDAGIERRGGAAPDGSGAVRGELRPADQRAPGPDPPRARDVPRAGRRRGAQRRETGDVLGRRAARDPARGARRPARHPDQLVRRAARRLCAPDRGARTDPRPAGGLRLRVRVRDGADEQAHVPGDRDAVHDDEPAVLLRELVAAQGAGALRRERRGLRASDRRQEARGEAGRRSVSTPIRFGTSGWRGVLTEEVTLPRADALVDGVARWLDEAGPHGGRPRTGGAARVLVAHDTRCRGAPLAARARARLAAAGHRAVLAASPVPTPVVAHAVRRGKADAAIVFTASHNPPEYQCVKVIAAWGGCVTDAQARRIEAHAGRVLARGAR